MRASPCPGAATVRSGTHSDGPVPGREAASRNRSISVTAALPLGLLALLTLFATPGAAADDTTGAATLGDVRVELAEL
ncbi:peptidase M15, partial [Nocardiopsis tropica]|nr:peptidase M15 [Nocardiopsis tropica]